MRRIVLPALILVCAAGAQELKPISLPSPQMSGGKPLMQALAERHSSRAYSPEKLSTQVLSNVLWAAFGINRADGKRTAPSAMNRQETEIYAVLAEGIFRYDAKANRLDPVAAGDQRAVAGSQEFVKTAPLNLVYVADLTKMGKTPGPQADVWAAVSVGAMVQNVYLYCASEGLGSVVRAWIDAGAFAKAAGLKAEQHVIIAQTVGYTKK